MAFANSQATPKGGTDTEERSLRGRPSASSLRSAASAAFEQLEASINAIESPSRSDRIVIPLRYRAAARETMCTARLSG